MQAQCDDLVDRAAVSGAPFTRHRQFRRRDPLSAQKGCRFESCRLIVDDNGVPWEALYTLEQEPDGSVKILGCVLLKPGQAV
jgi:hypothetical protein